MRERKMQRTRELIAETARRLFAENGFEAVKVADIAREADVSEKTVYNYFPTKEDLFYSRLEAFEEELLAAVRDRAKGVTVLEAFRAFLLVPRGLLARGDADQADSAREQLRTIARVIASNPALLEREQQVYARYTDSLAALLASETGAGPGDVEPWVVANALIGVHRALIDAARARILTGDDQRDRLARDLRAQLRQACARLDKGLGGYGAAG